MYVYSGGDKLNQHCVNSIGKDLNMNKSNSEWCCNISCVSDSGFDWIMQPLKWLFGSLFPFGDLSCSGSVAPDFTQNYLEGWIAVH